MLAWGRVQGVSLARGSWLAVLYLGRSAQGLGEPGQLIDLGSNLSANSKIGPLEPGALGVAFVSLQPGTGCSSVCRAVGAELTAAAEKAGRFPGTGPPPNLILYDWGSRPREGSRSGRLIALVLVWDGIEVYPGQLAGKSAAPRCASPLAFLLVALNRAGPASDLGSRIAAAGARLVCTLPADRSLGTAALGAIEAPAPPSVEGARTLANSVLG